MRGVQNRAINDSAGRFEFRAKAGKRAEIYLYGSIGEDWFGEGITAKSFSRDLKALGDIRDIELHIDSPGGSVTDARAIYTLLVEHKANVTVMIDGYAASAASYIAMAGDDIAIAEGGFFMIHEARGLVRGTSGDMRKAATLLETISATIADTYVARTGKTKSKVLEWMADETWFTGKEAVEHGFADRVLANKQLAAHCGYPLEAWNFQKVPAKLLPHAVKRRQIAANVERLMRNV